MITDDHATDHFGELSTAFFSAFVPTILGWVWRVLVGGFDERDMQQGNMALDDDDDMPRDFRPRLGADW